MTLIDPIPRTGETTPETRLLGDNHHQFEFERPGARYVIEVATESADGLCGDPEIIHRGQQVHGWSYTMYEYFDRRGLTKDGRLVPKLDGTRATPDGTVEATYLVARGRDERLEDAKATVRMLRLGPNGELKHLPTCKYFDNAQPEEGSVSAAAIEQWRQNRGMLEEFRQENGPDSIEEVAALATIDGDHTSSFELIRSLVQASMIKKYEMNEGRKPGEKEKEVRYLASLTKKSMEPVLEYIDPRTTEILGGPVQIYAAEDLSKNIEVTAVLMDLSMTVDYTVSSAIEAELKGKDEAAAEFTKKVYELIDGLDPLYLSHATKAFLAEIESGADDAISVPESLDEDAAA